MPYSSEMRLAPALAIALGIDERREAGMVQRVESAETLRLRWSCRRAQEPVTMAVLSRRARSNAIARIGDGLARGDQGELREAVESSALFRPCDLRRDNRALRRRWEIERSRRDQRHRPDPASAGCRAHPRNASRVRAESGDHADAGDGDTPRHSAPAYVVSCLARHDSFSIPSAISRTERIWLRRVIRNIDVEFAFKREQDIDAVQRIDFQLLEGAVDGHRFGRNVLGFRDDAGDAGDQIVVHRIWLTVSN